VFDKFKGHPVSVIGGIISIGEWFGDVVSICNKFNIPHYPKFNGGIYYLEKGILASKVYQTARDLVESYDDIGFVRLRNHANDEVLMALAMQLNNQRPVPDDGTIMSDPLACPGDYRIDVIAGTTLLTNPSYPNDRHQKWYPFTKVSPIIVHFLGNYTDAYPYKREVYRLKKAFNYKLNFLTEGLALMLFEYPQRMKNNLKNIMRPIYYHLFGHRNVKASNKI
jgi:hypothetical protein